MGGGRCSGTGFPRGEVVSPFATVLLITLLLITAGIIMLIAFTIWDSERRHR
jgi:hypothetical protein